MEAKQKIRTSADIGNVEDLLSFHITSDGDFQKNMLKARNLWKILPQTNLELEEGENTDGSLIFELTNILSRNEVKIVYIFSKCGSCLEFECSSKLALALIHGYLLNVLKKSIHFVSSVERRVLHVCEILAKLCCKHLEAKDPYQTLAALNHCIKVLCKFGTRSSNFEPLLPLISIVIHCHWNSRFSGISEKLIPETIALWTQLGGATNRDFGLCVLKYYVGRVPWFVKGKYRIIACQLKQVSARDIDPIFSELLNQLTRTLSKQHLARLTSTVFAHLVKMCSDDEKRMDLVFAKVFSAVTSPSRMTQRQALRHWIPILESLSSFQLILQNKLHNAAFSTGVQSLEFTMLKPYFPLLTTIETMNPTEYGFQIDECSFLWTDSERAKLAWLEVWNRKIRSNFLSLNENYDIEFLLDEEIGICLRSRVNEIRLEAFCAFVDLSMKTWETGAEGNARLNIIRSFLTENCIVDDGLFRMTCQKKFRTFISEIMRKKLEESGKDAVVKFLNVVVSDCLDNLCPGVANYQRLSSSLNVLILCLDETKSEKEIYDSLRNDGNKEIQLKCIASNFDNSCGEIRKTVSELLTNHFTPDNNEIKSLWDNCLRLCGSPVSNECDSGCDILKFLMRRKSINIDFGTALILSAENSLEHLEDNFGSAVKKNSLHGFLKALDTFIRLDDSVSSEFYSRTLKMATNAAFFALEMLGSSDEGECPSFCDMETALASHFAAQIKDGDSRIPQELQVSLACCSLILKDCSSLLATLMENSVAPSKDVAQVIGDVLYNILTRIRYIGVLEACAIAMKRFAEFCFASYSEKKESDFSDIPLSLLEKILGVAEGSVEISASRRGLGFPLVVESILSADKNCKRRTELINSTIERLIKSATELICKSIFKEEKIDSPLVRLVNCLTVVIKSSQFGIEVLPHIGRACELAIPAFKSKDWAVANAAQLLSAAIVWRIFGKCSISGEENAESGVWMSLTEFYSLLKPVWTFCCSIIGEISKKLKEKSGNLLDRRLYPVVSLLGNVVVMETDLESGLVFEELLNSAEELADNLIQLECSVPDVRLRNLIQGFRTRIDPIRRPKKFCQGSELCTAPPSRQNEDLELSVTTKHSSMLGWLKRFYVATTRDTTFSETETELLSEFAQGIYGSSIGSLALPLLTVQLKRSPESQKEPLLRVWVEGIVRGSKEKLSEQSRLSAALSLSITAQWIWNPESQLNPASKMRLFFASVDLLQDEMAYIRFAISPIASQIVRHQWREQSLLKEMFNRYHLICEDASLLLDAIEQRLKVTEPSKEVLVSNERCQLFKQKDFNIYAEPFIFYRLSFLAVQSICKNGRANSDEFWLDPVRLNETREYFAECHKFLCPIGLQDFCAEIILDNVYKLWFYSSVWSQYSGCDEAKEVKRILEKFIATVSPRLLVNH